LGKNSIFCLKIKILVFNENIIGVASGTALTLKALPLPQPFTLKKLNSNV